MDGKSKIIVFIAMVILTGIPMWSVDYNQYSNNSMIAFSSVAIAAVCAGILAYKTVHRKRNLILYITGAHMLSLLIKVLIDCREDPTNHNLFPIELLFFFIADTLCFLVVIFIVRVLEKDSRH